MFVWPVRVYYEDTDAGGVVYHANYLKFMERARSEWLRSVGCEQDQLRDRDNMLFAVRRIQLDYRQPARFNDELEVHSSISRSTRTRLTLDQNIFRKSSNDVLCQGTVEIVCVAMVAGGFKARPLPEWVFKEMCGER